MANTFTRSYIIYKLWYILFLFPIVRQSTQCYANKHAHDNQANHQQRCGYAYRIFLGQKEYENGISFFHEGLENEENVNWMVSVLAKGCSVVRLI